MKKVLMASAIIMLVNVAKAQISLGVNAGGLFSNFKTSYDGKNTEGEKGKIGFKVGVQANIPITSGLSFTPELNYLAKGGKYSNTTESSFFGTTIKSVNESTVNFSYLELPLNVTYSLANEEGTGLFFGAGPSLSFGVGGKYSSKATSTTTTSGSTSTSSSSEESKVKFDGKKAADLPASDDDVHLKALEIGATAFVGYHFTPQINARLMYNAGLSNIDPNDKSKANNSYFGLTVGYKF